MANKRLSVQQGSPPSVVNYDLDFMNTQLMRDPRKLDVIFRRFAPSPLINYFGVGDRPAGVSEMSIDQKGIAESLIRWRITDDTIEPTTILNSSAIPSVIYPGKEYEFDLGDSWFEAPAIMQTENPDWTVMISAKVPSPSEGGTKYKFQPIGSDSGDGSFPVELLQSGRRLNYLGNAHGEKSSTGQPLWINDKAEDYFNTTTFMRHELEASGHAMSTESWTYLYEQNQVGNSVQKKPIGFLPFAGRLLSDHMDYVGQMLYFARGNFDPIQRKIINKINNGRHSDRPVLSGLKEQMDSTRHVWQFDPINDTLGKITRLIDRATRYHRQYMRIPGNIQIKWMIMTRSGGDMVVSNAWANNIQGMNIRIEKGSDGMIEAGFGVKGYRTVMGDTIDVMNLDFMRPRGTAIEEVSYDGIPYDKSSFDLYLVPYYSLPDDPGRKNISVYTKQHKLPDGTNINRGLVIGVMNGMTGMGNGMGLDVSKIKDQSIDKQVNAAFNSKYAVGSETDGIKYMVGSEFSVVMYDPDQVLKLEAVFKRQY